MKEGVFAVVGAIAALAVAWGAISLPAGIHPRGESELRIVNSSFLIVKTPGLAVENGTTEFNLSLIYIQFYSSRNSGGPTLNETLTLTGTPLYLPNVSSKFQFSPISVYPDLILTHARDVEVTLDVAHILVYVFQNPHCYTVKVIRVDRGQNTDIYVLRIHLSHVSPSSEVIVPIYVKDYSVLQYVVIIYT